MSFRNHARQLLGGCLIATIVGCSTNAKFLHRGWPSLASNRKTQSTAKPPQQKLSAAPLQQSSTGETRDSSDWSPIKLTGLFSKSKTQQVDNQETVKLHNPKSVKSASVESASKDSTFDSTIDHDTMELRDSIEDSIDAELEDLETEDGQSSQHDNSMSEDDRGDYYDDEQSHSIDAPIVNGPNVNAPNVSMVHSQDDYSYRPRDANSLPSQFRMISESEMLSIALTNAPVLRSLGIRIVDNPAAAASAYDSAISASDPFFGPDAALAEFDRNYTASINTQNNDRVFNNAILGGQVQELTQDLVNLNTSVQKRSLTGATWSLNSLTGYDSNNRTSNLFPSAWETQVELGVRQPLLQGAGKQFNLIAGPNAQPGFNFSNGIVIARMNTRISEADFGIALGSYVRDLYTAYWNLVRQYHAYKSILASRELAYETWQTIRAKAKAELEGGEANKEAQARAKYYSYRRQVQIALGGENGASGLYVAERQLRQLIGKPPVDGELLTPADSPATARFVFDYDHLLARAMTGRTELRRQSIRIRQQELRLIAAKNFLLPQLDLIGRYRLRGFGDDLIGGSGRFSSAQRDFFSLDHQEWEFGLEMGVAAGRRQARAAIRNAHLQLARERAVYHEQKNAISHDVSNAHAEVSSAYYAMESSMAQVEASRQRLKASEALFKADKIEIEFLLDAQEELLRAEIQLATDQSRYSISLVQINATSGTLLSDIGIHLTHNHGGSSVSYVPTANFNSSQNATWNNQGAVLSDLNQAVPTPQYESVQPEPLPEVLDPVPSRDIEKLKLETAQLPKLRPADNASRLLPPPVARLSAPTPQRDSPSDSLPRFQPKANGSPEWIEPTSMGLGPAIGPKKSTPIVHRLQHGDVQSNPYQKQQTEKQQAEKQQTEKLPWVSPVKVNAARISPTLRSGDQLNEQERTMSNLFETLNTLNINAPQN